MTSNWDTVLYQTEPTFIKTEIQWSIMQIRPRVTEKTTFNTQLHKAPFIYLNNYFGVWGFELFSQICILRSRIALTPSGGAISRIQAERNCFGCLWVNTQSLCKFVESWTYFRSCMVCTMMSLTRSMVTMTSCGPTSTLRKLIKNFWNFKQGKFSKLICWV